MILTNKRNLLIRTVVDDFEYDKSIWTEKTATGLLKPVWSDDVGDFIESATQEQIDAVEQSKVEARYVKIDKRITNLTYGAIAILLRLQGLENQELIARKELYEILYNNCVNDVNLDMVEAKRQLYNFDNNKDLSLEDYKALVIAEWTTLKSYFDKFLGMIETVRSKWKSFAPTIHNDRFLALESLLDTINETSQVSDAIPLFNKIMKL